MRFLTITAISLALVACNPLQEPVRTQAASSDPEGTLFVANKRDASLSKVDLASGDEVKRVDSCADPHELAISPDGAHVAVVCYSGSGLEVFTTDTLQKVADIELGEGARPHGILWHASGRIVATAEGRGTIFTVDEPVSKNPVVTEIGDKKGQGPHMVVLSEDGLTAWGAVIADSTVIRYDLAAGKETHRIQLSGNTEAIGLMPDGSALFVGTLSESQVFQLDPSDLSLVSAIRTGRVPIRLMPRPSGDYMVSSDLQDRQLSVIDPARGQVVRTIKIAEPENGSQVTLRFSPDGSRAYVAEPSQDTIAEVDFDSGTVLRRLTGGPGGDGLAVTD